MPKELKKQVRKKRISNRGGIRKAVYISKELLDESERVRGLFETNLKETVTLAFMIREGLKTQLQKMRSNLRKAEKGAFHAKPRNKTKTKIRKNKNAA